LSARRIALAAALLGWAAPALLAGQVRAGRAAVAYISGQSVYISAGSQDGLRTGDSVRVVRNDSAIAVLSVAYLSSHQSSCNLVSSTTDPVVGDIVTFVPHALVSASPDVAVAAAGGGATSAPPVDWRDASRLRGRVGARYLSVQQQDGSSASYAQPGLDLRLDGQNLGGTPIGLTIDVRSRRTVASNVDGSSQADGTARVYQAVIFAGRLGARQRLAIGRQYSPALAPISLFDGALGELNRSRWSAGIFAGTQPGLVDLSFDTALKEFGTYVQLHQRPESRGTWSLTLGLVDSYDHSHADREFGFLQAALTADRWGFYLAQEVDYYTPAKVQAGESSSISPTSSYGSAFVRLGPVVDLNAGFDNRRSVRLYRDVINPVTQFDDAFRQGAWGSVGIRLGNRARGALDVRTRSGGLDGRADAFTLSLTSFGLTRANLFLTARATRYTGDQSAGTLLSGAAGMDLLRQLRLELNGGYRQEQLLLGFSGPSRNNLWWGGADLEYGFSSAWFFQLSLTRETGDAQNDTQIYGGLSYRF
jgi:hypothetical protein